MPIDFSKFQKKEDIIIPTTIKSQEFSLDINPVEPLIKIQSKPSITKAEHKTISGTEETYIQEFLKKLALGSESERHLFNAIAGKTVRGSNENVEMNLDKILTFLHTIFGQYSQKELGDPIFMKPIIDDLKKKLGV